MDLSASMQSMKDLLLFPFRDQNWKSKLLIGSGMTLAGMVIPFIPWFFVAGYGARLLRAGAANTDAERLPNWDDWGEMFIDGLRLMGAGLLVSLPAILLMGAGWVFYMIGVINMSSAGGYPSTDDAMLMVGSMLVMFLTMGLGMLIGLAAGLFFPPALGHVAVQRRFGAFFDVRGWLRILRANFGGFALALLLFLTVYLVAMMAFQILYFTFILCFLTPLLMMPAAFYSGLIYYRLIGQAYGDAQRKLNLPEPGAALEAADETASNGSAPLPVS